MGNDNLITLDLDKRYVLEVSQQLTEEQVQHIRERWRGFYGGDIVVLGPGMRIARYENDDEVWLDAY